MEFLQASTDYVNDLMELSKVNKEMERLSHSLKKGRIVLLPKPRDRGNRKKYRPITILNSTYKVQAKLIALRMQ